MRKIKARPALALLLIFTFLLSGCLSIKPTYTKEKIVESITILCKQEYNIEPRVWLLGETVWIYIPLPRLITQDAQWDKEVLEKINKVMLGTCRVLLSMKPRPQFLAIVASDTQEHGLDYTIITWIPDIVKFQLQFISRDEFTRRAIIKIERNILALSDSEGSHIRKNEIRLEDFLAEQIAQRAHLKFALEPKFKDYFKVEGANAAFEGDTLKIGVQIEQIKPLPQQSSVDIQKETAKIAAYVFKEYEFKDFLWVEVKNSATKTESLFSRLDLKNLL